MPNQTSLNSMSSFEFISILMSIVVGLGMTNLLIQRLARKGLIKVTQLDWKRTQYLLTLKGGPSPKTAATKSANE